MAEITASERRHNFAAKIVCLLLALILWIYVMEVENPNWEVAVEDVPVTLLNTDDIEIDRDLTIYSGYQMTIDLTLRGRRRLVENITSESIKIEADVSNITKPGEYDLPITVTAPDDTEIITQSAKTVTVLVDRRDRITVPIRVKYGSFMYDDSYRLGEPVLSVREVTVTGPSRYLGNIDYAEATIPDLGRITSSQTAYCPLSLIDRDGGVVTNQYVAMSISEVSVQVPLYMSKVVPLTVKYAHDNYDEKTVEVKMNPSSIRITGDASVIRGIDSINVTTINDKDKANLEDRSFITPLTLPDGVENPDGITDVTVTVTHIGTTTREIYVQFGNLAVINPNGVSYEITQPYLMLTVRGTPEQLAGLSWMNITPQIDLSAYNVDQTGSVTVPLKFIFLTSDSVYEVGEYPINVTLNPSAQG